MYKRLTFLALLLLAACTPHSVFYDMHNPDAWYVRVTQGWDVTETETEFIVHKSYGGQARDVPKLVNYLYTTGKSLVIEGECLSSCSVVLDQAIIRGVPACVSKEAELGFHSIGIINNAGYFLREESAAHLYRPAVSQWVKNNGGWSYWNMVYMSEEDLELFYETC